MKKIIEHLLVMWFALAHILTGLVGFLSLGFYIPTKIPLRAVTILARYREDNGISRQKNRRKK